MQEIKHQGTTFPNLPTYFLDMELGPTFFTSSMFVCMRLVALSVSLSLPSSYEVIYNEVLS